ncbi:YdcF family protein [Pseudoroseomonas wenyumeiae]
MARLAALAGSVQGVALAVLALVVGVAVAVVAVATRAGIAARREAIEIFHDLGATQRDIAGRFARRIGALAAGGALAGAALAVPALIALSSSPRLSRGRGGDHRGAALDGLGLAAAGGGRHRLGHGAVQRPPLVAAPAVSRLWLLPGLLALALLAGFAFFLGQSRARPEMPLRHTEGIAVLTGGPERVEMGLRLLSDGLADHLIVSGVGRSAELADLARSNNIPATELPGAEPEPPPVRGAPPGVATPAVTLGRLATSTRGNGQEIAAWARGRVRSLRVVTAAYHMPRALLELRRNLPEVALVPHPVQVAGPRASLLLREYAKLIGAFLGLSTLKTDLPHR